VVMVTALDSPADRLKGLQAGADDFLTKPIKDVALLARVKSLVRLKMLTDELREHTKTNPGLGLPDPLTEAAAQDGRNGRVLLLEDRANSAERMAIALQSFHKVEVEALASNALERLNQGTHDILVISLSLEGVDSLRLISQIRAQDRFRNLPILVLAEMDDEARVIRAFDLGAHDFLSRPIDRNELVARVSTQIRKKRYQERLRQNLNAAMELAIVDPLTKLHNRRYFFNRLTSILQAGLERGQSLSLLVMDIDHFKSVNDTYGHDIGDVVLIECAQRLGKFVREHDVVARFGGEEFVILLNDTDSQTAQLVAERLRLSIERTPIGAQNGQIIVPITVSIGVCSTMDASRSADSLFKLADEALYQAKRAGRNRVMIAA
jgi:two-component system, cell cycle response regulator